MRSDGNGVLLVPARDIGGVLGPAFAIDHDWQVAARPDCVHDGEEVVQVSSEKVADVVLRGGDQHVDASLVEVAIELRRIERHPERWSVG